MAFTLPALPYAFNALEPHIDARTMEIHHGKHHNAYVTNLNNAIAGKPEENLSIEEICKSVSKYPAAVRNNGGGHYNHSLFWTLLSPKGEGSPSVRLAMLLNQHSEHLMSLRPSLPQRQLVDFGSGWAWLIV
jgi:Fe-Mn family superoxide dismutase